MVVEAADVSGFMPTAGVNFKRLQLKECLLHSKQYTCSQKMNNYTIPLRIIKQQVQLSQSSELLKHFLRFLMLTLASVQFLLL